MAYFVYLLITKSGNNYIYYVGSTNNLQKRVELHNKSKGAKFTRGRQWKIAYSRKYGTKSLALKAEYKLKKNYEFRKKIKNRFILK